jgi:hypothetical protein
MAVEPAVLRLPQLQKRCLKELTHHFTDRCVRTPDTCHHLKEGVPSISVLSNRIS